MHDMPGAVICCNKNGVQCSIDNETNMHELQFASLGTNRGARLIGLTQFSGASLACSLIPSLMLGVSL